VVTDDGHILTLHRIPSSKGVAEKPPVLLQHGLLGSSADWVVSGPEKGLGKRKYNLRDVAKTLLPASEW
jgi:lysosomal acid lipase/cholesteryl ester hydrolase